MSIKKHILKVFLCYAREDYDEVFALHSRLTKEDLNVWIDTEKLLPGHEWKVKIQETLSKSDVVIVCLSKRFRRAGFRQKEVRFALDTAMEKPEGEIFIIPARMEDCEIPDSLKKWQYVDLFQYNGYDKLIRALKEQELIVNKGPLAKLTKVSRLEKPVIKKNDNSSTITKKFFGAISLIILLILALFFSIPWYSLVLNLTPTITPVIPLVIPSAFSKTPTPNEVINIPPDQITPSPISISATAVSSPLPSLPQIGGADKIAFLNNNNIWIMDVDGGNLKSITNDKDEKFNLEWLPDGKNILYITGKTIKTVNIDTQKVETITSFSASNYFESFHVSPDGKQVAVSLARDLHVVPFDLEKFKNINDKDDMLAMNGCIFYNLAEVKDAIWSEDGKKLTIKFSTIVKQYVADTLRIIDIHLCQSSKPLRLDEFPASRFEFYDTIVNFDWDGEELFYINSNKRNHGFGHLGIYNTRTYSFQEVAPIENTCCYRDATFSPDGTHTIFAFQDIRRGSEGQIVLYYVPNEDMTKIGTLTPLPLPFGFFTEHNDAPMPELRPIN